MVDSPAIRIKKHLNNNGIKQSFVSEKTGINDSTLSAKLNGVSRLTAEDIELICEALGCAPNAFLKPKRKEEV